MIDRYLARIGVDVAGRALDLALLSQLQLAHLQAVPFENLDVYHRRGVTTDAESSVAKIVDRGRGGWCFELNGAFGWLLAELGFRIHYVSCRVNGGAGGGWGPDLDHCAVVVLLDDRRWFVDVGFGDCCLVPLPLVVGEHEAVPRPVRCRMDGERFVLADLMPEGQWVDQLSIDVGPRVMADFTPRSTYLQTEPGLHWTEEPFATRATDGHGSRLTIRPGVLRVRTGTGPFVDRPVADADWPLLLEEYFGLPDASERLVDPH